jgi:hypothetical protein
VAANREGGAEAAGHSLVQDVAETPGICLQCGQAEERTEMGLPIAAEGKLACVQGQRAPWWEAADLVKEGTLAKVTIVQKVVGLEGSGPHFRGNLLQSTEGSSIRGESQEAGASMVEEGAAAQLIAGTEEELAPPVPEGKGESTQKVLDTAPAPA